MTFRGRKEGLSALFDAILFFMIMLAATGALFCWASAIRGATTVDMATHDLGRYASDVLSSALECTLGPVDFTVGGRQHPFSGTVYDALCAVLQARSADPNCDVSALVDAVRGTFGLLVEKPFHFGLRASVPGSGPELCIPEATGASMKPGAVRWTCAAPLLIGGSEGELTLYIWR